MAPLQGLAGGGVEVTGDGCWVMVVGVQMCFQLGEDIAAMEGKLPA
jgi:hypothetical protein